MAFCAAWGVKAIVSRNKIPIKPKGRKQRRFEGCIIGSNFGANINVVGEKTPTTSQKTPMTKSRSVLFTFQYLGGIAAGHFQGLDANEQKGRYHHPRYTHQKFSQTNRLMISEFGQHNLIEKEISGRKGDQ